MSVTTKIPMPDGYDRIETGPVQFGDDWPSVHIRGDHAAFYLMALESSEIISDAITETAIDGLKDLLRSSRK